MSLLLEARILSCGWVLIVPSARLEAYSALARGLAFKFIATLIREIFCFVTHCVKPPECGIKARDHKSCCP